MANDTYILIGILAIFISLGVAMPYINTALEHDASNVDINDFEDSVGGVDIGSTTPWGIIISVASMFFWTFGSLPVYVDAFFVLMRVTFFVIIYRLIRSGSG